MVQFRFVPSKSQQTCSAVAMETGFHLVGLDVLQMFEFRSGVGQSTSPLQTGRGSTPTSTHLSLTPHHCLSVIPDFLSGSQSSAFSDPRRHRSCFCPSPSALSEQPSHVWLSFSAAPSCRVATFSASSTLQCPYIQTAVAVVHLCMSHSCT